MSIDFDSSVEVTLAVFLLMLDCIGVAFLLCDLGMAVPGFCQFVV